MGGSASRSSFLLEHDLFGKPDSTFPDHALGAVRHSALSFKGSSPWSAIQIGGRLRVDRHIAGADAGVRQASPPSFRTGNAYCDRMQCGSNDGTIAFGRAGPPGPGWIFVDLKKPVIGCNVVDISAGGACI